MQIGTWMGPEWQPIRSRPWREDGIALCFGIRPFEAGDNKKAAVKIVDDRGIESLKIIPHPAGDGSHS